MTRLPRRSLEKRMSWSTRCAWRWQCSRCRSYTGPHAVASTAQLTICVGKLERAERHKLEEPALTPIQSDISESVSSLRTPAACTHKPRRPSHIFWRLLEKAFAFFLSHAVSPGSFTHHGDRRCESRTSAEQLEPHDVDAAGAEFFAGSPGTGQKVRPLFRFLLVVWRRASHPRFCPGLCRRAACGPDPAASVAAQHGHHPC